MMLRGSPPIWAITLVGVLAMLLGVGPTFAVESNDLVRTRVVEALTHKNLGLAYLEQGKGNQALEEFKRVIQLLPDEPLGYANLGLAFFRMNKIEEAERWVREALRRDPSHPDAHALLAEVLQWRGAEQEAIKEYLAALATAPANVHVHDKLVQLSQKQKNPGKAAEHLKAIEKEHPQNVVVLLELSRLLLQQGQPKEAIGYLQRIEALFEGVEDGAMKTLKEALARMSNPKEAAQQVQILTNLLRPTPLYRQGITQVSSSVRGLPLMDFSPTILALVPEALPREVPILFADMTLEVGLPTAPLGANAAVFFDLDRDGDLDLYVCSSTSSHLFINEGGRFIEGTDEAGVGHEGPCWAVAVGDLDNDGLLDLFLVNDGPNVLYHNDGDGRFTDWTKRAGVGDAGRGRGAIIADLDHDGDLDLFVVNDASRMGDPPSRLYRNRGDGTFVEITRASGFELDGVSGSSGTFGDLDDDGDIDLLIAGTDGTYLYTNLRQGRFKEIAREAGLADTGGHHAVTLGDYNNDGFLDLFLAGGGQSSNRLFRNKGDGAFVEELEGSILAEMAKAFIGHDAHFADFDNDGHLDLLVIGEPKTLLLRNTGQGTFTDRSTWLPPETSGKRAAIADFDNDGDLDILLVGTDGRIVLLRNDGGNRNHWLKVKLVGLNVGNSKNNLDGLGAKVEIKAGPLYQMRVVQSPIIHFGLGIKEKADLLRVIWPNGEPDILIEPGPDQVIQAEQRLKGSCPFLYTWDGKGYTFVTDIHWRNLLGMVLPDGSYAPPDPAKDFFKIPGGKLRPKDSRYSLQITEELWETTFLDQVKHLVVDHPEEIEVFVDEKFVPPPFPPFRLFPVQTKRAPLSAFDDQGNDILPLLRQRDREYLAPFTLTPYQGYTREHAITLDLGDLSAAKRIVLFLYGWLTPFDSSINVAVSQRGDLPFQFPSLQVIGKDGRWQTIIENIGAPAGKDKTFVVDLTGRFLTRDFRVRITTTMQIFWDEIFFSTDDEAPVRVTSLAPLGADLHDRGFSRPYQESPQGPTLFDYTILTQEPKWRPMEGLYTRYGDVHPLLLEPDDLYVIMGPGDELTVEFDAQAAPLLPPGWARDFVISTEGWIKEGETNGALAQTVEPLLFHGMSRYPYGPEEHYPDDLAHREFLRTYNTRLVTGEAFRESVKRYIPSP